MKNYMPLDGLRCSRDSGSAHCDTPKSAVLGRPGGEIKEIKELKKIKTKAALSLPYHKLWRVFSKD